MRSRVRIALLLQAWKRNLLKGELWNNALNELVRDSPARVAWWRAAATGTLVLLSARNSDAVCAAIEREPLDADSNADPGAQLARIHAALGGGKRQHPDDCALAHAERALELPVCALELDAPTSAQGSRSGSSWYQANKLLVAAVSEAERLLTAISLLEFYYPGERQRSPQLRWALQFASVLLARAHLLPVLEHVMFEKNMEKLRPAFDALKACARTTYLWLVVTRVLIYLCT